jgi:hypothetical protein
MGHGSGGVLLGGGLADPPLAVERDFPHDQFLLAHILDVLNITKPNYNVNIYLFITSYLCFIGYVGECQEKTV